MKKVISILMSVLIIVLSFAFIAGAEDEVKLSCNCKDHKSTGLCYCCAYCENIDSHYLTSCLRNGTGTRVDPIPLDREDGTKEYVLPFCCSECTGIYPCSCACDCCTLSDEEIADLEKEPILTPEQQEAVVDTFQKVLGQIRDFFDKLFDAIFEFLRFDEIMGTN